METTMGSLITAADSENRPAADVLFDSLYAELHRMARRERARQGPVVGLGVTTLLHEAYLKISGTEGTVFPDRNRFMAYASRAMRRLVIDFVRERRALKRGAAFEITAMPTESGEPVVDGAELQRISDGLDELAGVDAALAELVDLKFFCGFSFAEIAALRAVSERTVQRDWNKARLFLHDALLDA